MSYSESKGTALITGGVGFAGRYLTDCLQANGREVHVLDLNRVAARGEDWERSDVPIHLVDLTHPQGLREILKDIKPSEIYHLAGRANVKSSWQGEAETYTANVIGAVNLLCAVRDSDLPSDILIISSGEVYGLVPEADQPIVEKQPAAPRSPYAASKLCQEIACLQIARTLRGKTVIVRPFNHIGPGQRMGFVTADFACQIALIERSMQEPVIHVGNLDACRDFTDVRDTVNGYMKALQSGRSGEIINVCSGQAWSIRRILDSLISLSSKEISVTVDIERFRPADIPLLSGSHESLSRLSGWRPQRAIEDTLAEILDYWRQRVLTSDMTLS